MTQKIIGNEAKYLTKYEIQNTNKSPTDQLQTHFKPSEMTVCLQHTKAIITHKIGNPAGNCSQGERSTTKVST